jgi:hypothetical protein
MLPRTERAARVGGSTNTWGYHVFYRMRMMAALSWFDIVT